MTITIALPSKGRMKDDASAIFERAGMKIVAVGNDRSYRGRVEGWDDVEIAFLSASEISRELGNGSIDFGVTGEDLVREGLPMPTLASSSAPASASAMPMSSSPFRRSGTTSTPWPTSATSPPTSAPATGGGWRLPPNTGG